MITGQAGEGGSVYFTILPSRAGFTDQLYQFSVFYKLGLSLGYKYLHSNYISSRKGSEDIYDFLGFNDHFHHCTLTDKDKLYRLMGTNDQLGRQNIGRFGPLKRFIKKTKFWVIKKLVFDKYNFVDVGLDDEPLKIENLEPIEHFHNMVRNIASKKFSRDPERMNVLRFYLLTGRYFFLRLAPSVCQRIPYFPDGLDLRSTYLQRLSYKSARPIFNKGKIKLQMHIRLGDTALIETPWHSYVPLWSGRPISPLREYSDRSDKVFTHTMDVIDYCRFLKKFTTFFEPDDVSVAVFSDGYERAFNELYRMLDDLDLDDVKIHALKESALTYEQQRFSIFDEIENSVCVVGETNAALKELVIASLVADVIVMGCNQNMISKLLVAYSHAKTDKPLIVIMLYRDRLPDYQIILGERAVIYPVNANSLDSDDNLAEVVTEIRCRYLTLPEPC